jgi:hypothetical protein
MGLFMFYIDCSPRDGGKDIGVRMALLTLTRDFIQELKAIFSCSLNKLQKHLDFCAQHAAAGAGSCPDRLEGVVAYCPYGECIALRCSS